MRKKILCVLIAPLLILACNFLFPVQQQDKKPLSASGTTETTPDQSALSTPEVYSTSSFTIARIHKENGDILSQLKVEAQKAKGLGLSPFIEFDATWCPSCVIIDKNIKTKEPLTTKAFEGVYLIRADVDEWGWGDGKNFKFDAIPIYYKLSSDGKPTGAVIDGGVWGDDTPQNFAPVLDKFFHDK
jgi:hypothetical protein